MKKKLIIGMLLICVIVLIVLVGILNSLKTTKEENIDYFEQVAQKDYNLGKIIPQNFTTLYREYEGEANTEIWYEKIYQFVHNYIPEIQKAKSLQDYYNQNEKKMKSDLGNTSYDHFEKLAKKIKNLKSTEFKDSAFDVTSLTIAEDSLSIKLTIFFYKEEELELKFVVYPTIKENRYVSFLAE